MKSFRWLMLLFSLLLTMVACRDEDAAMEDGDLMPTLAVPADLPLATPTLMPTQMATPVATIPEATVEILTPSPTAVVPTETPVSPTPIPPQKIMFEPGATSIDLQDSIEPGQRRQYIFRALAGQQASIEISSATGGANFSLAGMSDGQPYKRLENEDRAWQGTLPSTQDYLITVAATGEAVAYTFTLTIDPLSSEPVPLRFEFQPGGISAKVSGNIHAPDRDVYLIRALAGQQATITIVSSNRQANFSLVGLDDGQPYKRLENEARFWQGMLPATQDYRISVATPQEQSSYELSLTIMPLTGDAPDMNPLYFSELFGLLVKGAIERDYAQLRSLMLDDFFLGLWQSEGSVLTADEARAQLSDFMGSSTMTSILPLVHLEAAAGIDPIQIWGPDAPVVSGSYVIGLGEDGESEALFAIAQQSDGRYYWYGALFAPDGFR
jgi:flagellar basal body rod protein FlgC